MADPAPSNTSSGLQLCRHIRTKMMYVMGRAELDLSIPSSTAQCQCLKTLTVTGPDGGLVTLIDCRSGRTCFEPFD